MQFFARAIDSPEGSAPPYTQIQQASAVQVGHVRRARGWAPDGGDKGTGELAGLSSGRSSARAEVGDEQRRPEVNEEDATSSE